MKNKLFFALILIPIFTLSCNKNDKPYLTYGTLAENSAIEIDGSTLLDKISKESFLLAIHPDDGSCGCWTYFSHALDAATRLYNLLIYKVNYQEINDELYNKGFYRFNNKPSFYIVDDGQILASYEYKSENTNPIFTNEKKLYEQIQDRINLPKMYFINQDQLDEKIASTNLIYYMRETCSDCNYATPHALMPYIKGHKFDNNIYVFNLDPLRSDLEIYQDFKDQYYLSNALNSEYGYDKGCVPTFHYYQNGTLKDAMVYFNDSISNGTITKSYYSEDRINHLSYTNTVLNGLNLADEYLNDAKNGWKNNSKQAEYYNPILIQFLDMYLK